MAENKSQKIALAHDFLTVWGGAERVFRAMADMYPEAPIYTLYYDERFVAQHFPGRTIRASFLQKLPRWFRGSVWAYPLYPVAVETLDLRDFDTVLSSSGAWMKGLVTRLHTRHVSYLHSPMRYVWDTFHEHPKLRHGFRFCKRMLLSYLRLWDKEAAARPDVLIANSRYTQARIEKYYRREAAVIYPPVTTFSTENIPKQDHTDRPFVVVSRLTQAKHVDVVVEAFNKLDLPLVIVGTGRVEKSLRVLAGRNIRFVGAVSDEKLARLYRDARALVQMSEEDFGLAVAEAQSVGVPVIAYDGGAIREIVQEGITGELFADLTPESVADGVRRFTEHQGMYQRERMREQVERFTREQFESRLRQVLERESLQ